MIQRVGAHCDLLVWFDRTSLKITKEWPLPSTLSGMIENFLWGKIGKFWFVYNIWLQQDGDATCHIIRENLSLLQEKFTIYASFLNLATSNWPPRWYAPPLDFFYSFSQTIDTQHPTSYSRDTTWNVCKSMKIVSKGSRRLAHRGNLTDIIYQ